jgi:hypothetical protein
MFFSLRLALAGTLAAYLLLAPAARAASTADEKPAAKESGEASPPAEKPSPKKELAPALVALRDRVRRTLAVQASQPLNTRDNTMADILQFCLAFGCDTNVGEGGPGGQKVNGITCLCWNMPCGGSEPLMISQGRITPRVGYGFQDSPGQMVAMLALSRVPIDYPVRVGDTVRTVADLVEYEKLSCRAGTDLAWRLVALSCYVEQPQWKDSLGEQWSLERMVKEELALPTAGPQHAGAIRLLGLSYALDRRAKQGRPMEGDFARAKQFVEESQDYALKIQNDDGSWGRPAAARGAAQDFSSVLFSTGRVLEWLALSLPADRLESPGMTKAVEQVAGLLSAPRYRSGVQSFSNKEIDALMHAAHALTVYDERVFQPADTEKPTAQPQAQRPGKRASR